MTAVTDSASPAGGGGPLSTLCSRWPTTARLRAAPRPLGDRFRPTRRPPQPSLAKLAGRWSRRPARHTCRRSARTLCRPRRAPPAATCRRRSKPLHSVISGTVPARAPGARHAWQGWHGTVGRGARRGPRRQRADHPAEPHRARLPGRGRGWFALIAEWRAESAERRRKALRHREHDRRRRRLAEIGDG